MRRLLCVGVDRRDADEAARPYHALEYERVEVQTFLAYPGKPVTGLVMDEVVKGPRLRELEAYMGEVVAPRVRPERRTG